MFAEQIEYWVEMAVSRTHKIENERREFNYLNHQKKRDRKKLSEL